MIQLNLKVANIGCSDIIIRKLCTIKVHFIFSKNMLWLDNEIWLIIAYMKISCDRIHNTMQNQNEIQIDLWVNSYGSGDIIIWTLWIINVHFISTFKTILMLDVYFLNNRQSCAHQIQSRHSCFVVVNHAQSKFG